MTGKELERELSLLTPFSAAHLDHVGRALRAAGLLPLGGRGIQAPDLIPQQAANMLIGVATAETPPQAPGKVALYAALPASWSGNYSTGRESDIRTFAGCQTFGEALTALLSKPELAGSVEELLIFQSWPRAVIVASNPDHNGFYGFADHREAAEAGFRASPCKLVFHLPGSVLQQVAIEMADAETRVDG